MLTVVTTRPPFTYAFTTSLQYISILEKLYFYCLMLKATKFIWCPNSLWCSSLLPPRQQGAFFFHVERTKRLWHDCSSSSSPGNRTWTRCESISLNYLPSGRNSSSHTSFLCRDIGRAERSRKFLCETRVVWSGKNILPNHGIVWKAIERSRRSLVWSWTILQGWAWGTYPEV